MALRSSYLDGNSEFHVTQLNLFLTIRLIIILSHLGSSELDSLYEDIVVG